MAGPYPAEADLLSVPPEPLGVALVVPAAQGPRFTPEAQLFIYTAAMWEEFIHEWARTLPYHKVRRFGGANDHGVDIAGFESAAGFGGVWDCFQCKHYKDALMPTDAWPEIYKVLRYAESGYYTLPRTYHFMAPRGLGATLDQMLLRPGELKAAFLKVLAEGKVGPPNNNDERDKIAAYAETADFSIFQSSTPAELLEQHKSSPQHTVRFAVPLPAAPPAQSPPVEPAPEEAKYLEQLYDVYAERFGTTARSIEDLAEHPKAHAHLRSQREYFYCAETFRIFYRDKVPPMTFENLQDQVHEGVKEIHDEDHTSGYERLQKVLSASQQINLTTNALISVWQARDKKGICHQLANDDRLRWCQ
ncbi:ABC-three component system protein [Micromonospora aurantiaca]|uniref:ABC-three component system protein n=1 Tax=Micromonospora aurantiaca (nom. illeg.) TaxID=47850 RepID=UPI003449842C